MREGLVRVGLTGGIATGKSYVTARLHAAGLPTIDADQLARDAVAPGSPGLAAVVERFGSDVLTTDGTLDRPRLGRQVFADTAARADLEAIIHPEVRRRIDAWQDALVRDGYRGPVFADIPLLFETQRTADFDIIVVVACDPGVQRARVMERDGLSAEAADQRIAAQWPIGDKVRRANHVIWTNGTFAETDAQIDRLVRQLRDRVST